ncbi:MAG: hypothetical protein KDA80_09195, partial [Planctomycetaceae bacterium]|nr:hypothetical protein [Planctomycetaceae bacterium]
DEQLCEFITQHPDATLKEIREGCQLPVSLTAISHALRRLGFTRKKKVTHATERDRPDVQARRRNWQRRKRKMDANHLVFVDENALSTQLQRT